MIPKISKDIDYLYRYIFIETKKNIYTVKFWRFWPPKIRFDRTYKIGRNLL